MAKENKNQNKKPEQPSIEEALGNRAGAPPHMTNPDLLKQARDDARVDKVQTNLEAPHTKTASSLIPPQIQPITDDARTKIKTETAKELEPTIPASTEKNPQEVMASTPESPAKVVIPKTNNFTSVVWTDDKESLGLVHEDPDDINLRRLKDYLNGEEFTPSWVMMHLAQITSNPKITPRISLWDKPNEIDVVVKGVYNVMMSPGFVDNTWPYLKVVMGSSRDNVVWCANVLTTIALFETIKILPFMEG